MRSHLYIIWNSSSVFKSYFSWTLNISQPFYVSFPQTAALIRTACLPISKSTMTEVLAWKSRGFSVNAAREAVVVSIHVSVYVA